MPSIPTVLVSGAASQVAGQLQASRAKSTENAKRKARKIASTDIQKNENEAVVASEGVKTSIQDHKVPAQGRVEPHEKKDDGAENDDGEIRTLDVTA